MKEFLFNVIPIDNSVRCTADICGRWNGGVGRFDRQRTWEAAIVKVRHRRNWEHHVRFENCGGFFSLLSAAEEPFRLRLWSGHRFWCESYPFRTEWLMTKGLGLVDGSDNWAWNQHNEGDLRAVPQPQEGKRVLWLSLIRDLVLISSILLAVHFHYRTIGCEVSSSIRGFCVWE